MKFVNALRELSLSVVFVAAGIIASGLGVTLTFGGIEVDNTVAGHAVTFNYEALAGILLLVGAAGPAFYWAGRWNQRLTHVESRLDNHLDRVIVAAERIATSIEDATSAISSRRRSDD